jgi:hypothetical protein
MSGKVSFDGRVLGVQPRIRLTRSFDQRSHSYLGYVLRVSGYVDDRREVFFTVGLGKATYTKHEIEMGNEVSGLCVPATDSRAEPAEYYKVSELEVTKDSPIEDLEPPPWYGVAPDLEIYRERGHRRLSAQTYKRKCNTCIWSCEMPVEIIVDQWNPGEKHHRRETFCYGPKYGERLDAGGGDGSTGDTSDMADAADAADTGSASDRDIGDGRSSWTQSA